MRQGRILVCEIHGYNLEGYYDIVELNKTGVLDTQVRRVLANEEAVKGALQQQYGTVKRLEDVDGDGVIDHSTILADRLPPCYGVVPARDGVIVFVRRTLFILPTETTTARRSFEKRYLQDLASARCGRGSTTRGGAWTTGFMA